MGGRDNGGRSRPTQTNPLNGPPFVAGRFDKPPGRGMERRPQVEAWRDRIKARRGRIPPYDLM